MCACVTKQTSIGIFISKKIRFSKAVQNFVNLRINIVYYACVDIIHIYIANQEICVSSNNILNFKLVRLGVYMVKLCHEKMLILRCILPPPQKKLNLLQKKKLNFPPPEKSRTP